MIAAGTRLGPYEITAKLGEGGMGEVWRATDSRLRREVAIKVLPAAFVADRERLARFEREAQTLAALNHPNVAALYGVEESADNRALVMELVEGEDLAARLLRGALPLPEALPIARQVAEALEAAHEQGIVHRDLKPANVKVRPDGTVKVLDFGLAKALEPGRGPEGPGSASALQRSPTLTGAPGTQLGVILGTAAYMSPEQALGKPADRRADVWAFGVVLFEMLTGRQPFPGDAVSAVLAAVLKDEPPWADLPPETPHELRRLLRRCLRKNPRERLQAIGDARLAVEELLTGDPETPAPDAPEAGTARSPLRRRALPWAVAGVAAAAALLSIVWRPAQAPPAERAPRRLSMRGVDVPLSSSVAISPDGREIVAYDSNPGAPRLVRRSLGSFEVVPLPAGFDAFNPFFSPDGRRIGFFRERAVCVAELDAAQSRCLGDADGFAMGHWGADDTIVFSHDPPGEEGGGLRKVSARGGEPATWLTRVDRAAGERTHGFPQVLPDGRHVLFSVSGGEDHLAIVPLAGGAPRPLLTRASRGRLLASGHLLYEDRRTGAMRATRFDPDRLAVEGEGLEVLRDLAITSDGMPGYDVSQEGTLVYSPAGFARDTFALVAVDRSGRSTPLAAETGTWAQPRVSPDGHTILLRQVQQPNCHLWVYDVDRRTLTRLSSDGDDHSPHWITGGDAVLFSRQTLAGSDRQVFTQRLDGGAPARLFTVPFPATAVDVSADERYVAVVHDDRGGRNDIFVFDRTAGELVPFATSQADEDFPAFSPDGRWLAYASDETGRREIYVRTFPGSGRKYPISAGGGIGPLWSHDGRELFFAEGDRMMRVAVTLEPAFAAGTPEVLFTDPRLLRGRPGNYDLAADGRSFVMMRSEAEAVGARELHVVLDWFSELERLVPLRGGR